MWWAFTDSNRGPIGYEPTALTCWAKGPDDVRWEVKFCFTFGRGEETRTPDPMVPNHVRYQLRYTPFIHDAFLYYNKFFQKSRIFK